MALHWTPLGPLGAGARAGSRLRRAPASTLLGACLALSSLATLGSACGANTAIVELDWAFVDRDGVAIFPGGKILENRDSCSLTGRDDLGTRSYALNVALVIEDVSCVESFEASGETGSGDGDGDGDGAGDRSTCEIARELFDCERARGAITEVPVSDEPYLMRVEVWADPEGEDETPFEVDTACIAVPGPRTRRVEGGKIADLAVYQLVANAIFEDEIGAGLLDLPGCHIDD